MFDGLVRKLCRQVLRYAARCCRLLNERWTVSAETVSQLDLEGPLGI